MKWLNAFPARIASQIQMLVSKSHPKKLLDDPGQLLYCDPEFDRQIAISLS